MQQIESFYQQTYTDHRTFGDLYVLLTKREVKMADNGQVLFAFFLTKTKSRSIKTQSMTRLIFSHFDRTSLVKKGFIIWPKKKTFTFGTSAGNPERARWAVLTHSCSQSERSIRFILHIRGFITTIKAILISLSVSFYLQTLP